MDTIIRISLALRLASFFAFPAGILTAVVLQRSPAIVLLLAVVMVLVRPLVLRVVKTEPPAWPTLNRFIAHFIVLAIFGGIVFVAFAGIGALFTSIDLADRLGSADLAIVGGWAVFAAAAMGISIRLLSGHVEAGLYEMRLGPFGRGPFGFGEEPGDARGPEGTIIEGEVIDADKPDEPRR